jgi:hypothetical protein
MNAPATINVINPAINEFTAVTRLLDKTGPSLTTANKLAPDELKNALAGRYYNSHRRPAAALKDPMGTLVMAVEWQGVVRAYYKTPGYRNLIVVWLTLDGERI